jgi:hypothetical protein
MRFEYDDYLKPDATTDRGWVRLADPSDHPQWSELPEHQRVWLLQFEPGSMNVGNWLDYEHGPDHQPVGAAPTIMACAYLFRFGPCGHSAHTIKTGWFWGIDEAKQFIEQTLVAYLDRQAVHC